MGIKPLKMTNSATAWRKGCRKCGREKDSLSPYCRKCYLPVEKMRVKAVASVAKLIRSGAIPKARELSCVDCGKNALDYDHRDYSKPLEVEPVCRSCNQLRGPAVQLRADWSKQ